MMIMVKNYIIMNSQDNCATALADVPENTTIDVDSDKITLLKEIKMGHKFATKQIQKGEKVIKYGQVIAITTQEIPKGEWVHTHNCKSAYLEEVKNE